ncbi:Ribokinase-like protein [Venturia nashicola]|uniref:Ribokinase n=1 Tax=Venturia nashicola TaxID=86259 RepID=A0A4Z1P4N3_9PEZI|nr:Ribokinase-like protein [Venturia nashicola]TLD35758.1 Ribokinase-like protein [Venturia nashicola]
MPVITIIGSINVDMVTRAERVPNAGETVQAKAFEVGWGGKGANQAVATARLSRSKETLKSESDITVRMIGAVGRDVFGPQVVKSMEEDGINMQGVEVLEGQETGTATILVEDSTGENRILVTPGANFALGYSEVDYGDIAIFQLESPMDVVLRHISRANSSGAHVIFNPAPAVQLPDPVYQEIGTLIVNESEAAALLDLPEGSVTATSDLSSIAAKFIAKGADKIIITLGGDGVFYQTRHQSKAGGNGTLKPAKKAKVVDTTAAGDTFIGAYAVRIASHIAESSPTQVNPNILKEVMDDAIAFAIQASAKTVERAGAQKTIPWLSELEAA